MTHNMKVLGINLQTNFDPARSFSIAAFGDVALPDMETTLRGVALAWSHGSFIALPPKVPSARASEGGTIQWNIKGKFAREVCDRLVKAYEAFGGDVPAGAANQGAAARRVSEKRGLPIEVPELAGLRRFVGDTE